MVEALALWHEGPGRSMLRRETVAPAPGEAVVRALVSAVSRGTERLVREGRVPESERARMRAPFQAGAFPFPVKYGYATVGVVEDGPADLIGREVFALHPHQTRFSLPVPALTPLPPGLPARRAALAANMETALNAVWDAAAAPGDRIAVIGAGPIGLLLAALLTMIPGSSVTASDLLTKRGETATQIGVRFAPVDQLPRECDLAFNASASAAGLATALDVLGDEGAAVELSWHGEGVSAIPLGGAFHARRLRIISSQVGAVPASRRARWSAPRRLALALDLLAADPRLDALIDAEIPFGEAAERFGDAVGGEGLVTLLRYD